MVILNVIQSQHLAALAMLKQAIVKCPLEIWNDPQGKDAFWFKAYHTIYYAYLYLQPSRKDFVGWNGRTSYSMWANSTIGSQGAGARLQWVEKKPGRR